jgi:predicted dienelactone hydrolase
MILVALLSPGTVVPDDAAPAAKAEAKTFKPDPGPYAVEISGEIILHDAKRNKDLPVHVTWPKGDGPFPVIVYSHGAFGSGDMVMGGLPKYWSSYGYVCLMPTHGDSMRLRRAGGRAEAQGGDEAGQPAAGDAGGIRDRAGLRGVVPGKGGGWNSNWIDRPKDITFLLDSLDDIEAKLPALKGKMDRTRIGVGGHSLGAYTAQLIGGATVDTPDGKGKSLADNRAAAILQLSGQGSGQQGLTEQSWDAFARPMMTMTGSRDRGAQGQGPEWKKEPFDRCPAGDKYHVFIEGAHHGSFNGRMATGEQKAIFGYVEMATLAFWDAYLRDDQAAKAYLQSDDLVKYSKDAVKLFRK